MMHLTESSSYSEHLSGAVSSVPPVLVLAALVLLLAACASSRSSEPAPEPALEATFEAASGPVAPVRERTADPLEVLFLGDGGLHQPSHRLRDVARPMLDRGIALYYTEDLGSLDLETLRRYDAVMLYANYEGEMPPAFEEALLTYVAEGGGFVPVHAASANFPGSERYADLVGAQFARHGAEVFRTRIAEPAHEVMQGFDGFESWDETYVHRNHNPKGRTVLSYREDEPWTWVREHGEGRVFYTAWGHDERTWRTEGFHDLLERGIRWAARQDVQAALARRTASNPFTYDVLDVPYPPPHEERVRYEATEGPMDRRSNYPMYYTMQKPLSGEAAIERMIVPAGFRVELFAAEPQIVNPVAMTWDERGRLWVVETIEYPYPGSFWPDGGGKDRIVILEDTDGDGRADEVTEFASGLNIPSALAFADGGVIVQQAPQTLFLKDTDGDDRADVREVLFEGWSQYDTHAGPSNIYYGLDNRIWGVLGYSGFEGTVGGEPHEFRMGVYRFEKDGSKLEFLRRTNNNTFGLGFNEEGEAFISTANGNPSTYLPFPRRLYERVDGLDDSVTESIAETFRMIPLTNLFRQVDFVGGYTAAAGHGLYTARAFPREYWNRVGFVTEATGGVVGEFLLEENGASYEAAHPRNLVASDDEWFSPVAADVGPDGAVWIADWYNYIIQHNAESDRQRSTPGNAYANPLRDRQHGRIYRVVYDGAPEAPKMSLAGASPQELVETLTHDNLLWRRHAQRLLVERGRTDVVPALVALVEDASVDALGLNVGAIHALWTLHGLGALDGSDADALAAAVDALEHASSGVRRNAVKVLPPTAASVEAILQAGLLTEADAHVRLDALVRLADLPADEAVGRAVFAVLQAPENMADRWIREAATLAGAAHADGFLNAADVAAMHPEEGVRADDAENLLPNSSFEEVQAGEPVNWSTRIHSGEATFGLAEGEGRGASNALKVTSEAGADASWYAPAVPLKKDTRYLIGGWVRTENLDAGTGRGAQFNLHGFPNEARTAALSDENSDWTYIETAFANTDRERADFNLLFGGWGQSRGTIYFDDVVLKELGADPRTTLAGITRMIRDEAQGAAAATARQGAAPADVDLVLELATVPDEMRFDKTELRAEPGQRVRLVFENEDNMEHNVLFILPGTVEEVGRLADELMMQPGARARDYVPDTDAVVAYTPVVEPYETFELTFTVPEEPGAYTFICTIPGHWRVMQGTLIVEPTPAGMAR